MDVVGVDDLDTDKSSAALAALGLVLARAGDGLSVSGVESKPFPPDWKPQTRLSVSSP